VRRTDANLDGDIAQELVPFLSTKRTILSSNPILRREPSSVEH